MSEGDVTRLVLRAQCGDRNALDDLLRVLQGPLHRYIRSICGSEQCDDVLQDSLVIICRKLRWLREPQCFRAWSFRIAGREALRRARHTRQHREVPVADVGLAESPSALEETELRAELALLERSLLALPPAARAVIWLHYIGQISISEVADILEISVGTAKSRLSYGLQKLRAQQRQLV